MALRVSPDRPTPFRFAGPRARAVVVLSLGAVSAATAACARPDKDTNADGTTKTLAAEECPTPLQTPIGTLGEDSAARLMISGSREKATIKGWIDEQRLAKRATAPATGLVYGPLARIIPVDRLESIKQSDFDTGYVQVARIQVQADSYPKLMLLATTYDSAGNDRTTNAVWLCRRASSPDKKWIARIDRPDGKSFYFNVDYEDHPGRRIPGSARWVWREDDETAWMMCAAGCCTLAARL